MELNQRVHYFGVLGRVEEFVDYHQEQVVVRWDGGSSEVMETKDLHEVTPEWEAVLAESDHESR
jgi:hypothetical protein